MEREKSEDPWKKAFEKAEISPSENVWTNIELELERARGGELKKRLMFYKMLAAASVVFAMAIGGVGYYYSFTSQSSGTLADNNSETTTIRNEDADTDNRVDSNLSEGTQNTHTDSRSDGADNLAKSPDLHPGAAQVQTQSSKSLPPSPRKESQFLAQENNTSAQSDLANDAAVVEDADLYSTQAVGSEEVNVNDRSSGIAHVGDDGEGDDVFKFDDKDVTPLYTQREVRLTFDKKEPEVDPVVAMLAMLDRREREVQEEGTERKKKDQANENLWTSIGFAAGSFNANQSSSPARPTMMNAAGAALAAPIVDQETKATGYSYTMGVNVGTKISDRWVLQGGVNYLTNSSEYTANNVVMEPMGKNQQQRFRAASTNDLVNSNDQELSSKLVYSAPYNVNNSMRYLSIPMQAGYMLVNKTFGLQLNAGVATDLFLQNTVKAESDQLAKTSQPSGSDSPYRAVNLSGLFGTEVSYRFGPHYRVSLNPGIRYPFNTIYKSELGVQSTPLTFDVGLRFRYIFN